jgi:hypothetical protein
LTPLEPSRNRVFRRRFTRWKFAAAALVPLNNFGREKGFVLFLCIFSSGCRFGQSDLKPAIEFTKVPSADVGGPGKLDTIGGLATGVQPGQQIVLYARSEEVWWVQPYSNRPFTKIQSGSRWKSETHLGTEYAALLVDQGYYPPQTAETLPTVGNGVLAVAVIKGLGPAPPSIPPKTIHFSGYEWTVRSAASNRGGSHNSFDLANAWTDESGALHLRIARSQGDWTCAEVRLTRSLGYGTYLFVVRDISHLEPSAVLTLFTWDGIGSEQNRRELDIEISRWGYRENDNAHYVVQPYFIAANQIRFTAPGGLLTHSFRWKPAEVMFSTVAGSPGLAGARVIDQHAFTSGIPVAGGDSVRMNLYNFRKGEIPLTNETEIVIEKFEYFP